MSELNFVMTNGCFLTFRYVKPFLYSGRLCREKKFYVDCVHKNGFSALIFIEVGGGMTTDVQEKFDTDYSPLSDIKLR